MGEVISCYDNYLRNAVSQIKYALIYTTEIFINLWDYKNPKHASPGTFRFLRNLVLYYGVFFFNQLHN